VAAILLHDDAHWLNVAFAIRQHTSFPSLCLSTLSVAGCILPIFAAGLEQLYNGKINVGFSNLIDCNRKETRGYSNQIKEIDGST
jgi:hypothetical protein